MDYRTVDIANDSLLVAGEITCASDICFIDITNLDTKTLHTHDYVKRDTHSGCDFFS